MKVLKFFSLTLLVAAASAAFLTDFSVLGGSQSPPLSSAPVTSQPDTVSNPPIVMAKDRSLPQNTVFVSPATNGGGSLKVSNGTNSDAFAKLVEPRSGTLVAAFYVKFNSNFTLVQIPDGTYQVLFVLGKDWDAEAQSFTHSKSFLKFDRPLSFTTTQLSNGIPGLFHSEEIKDKGVSRYKQIVKTEDYG
jgi:hypothetical protein